MNHNGALYVQVTGALYKVPLPLKTLTPPTREEQQNRFSVVRVEHNKYTTGDSGSTWSIFTFIQKSEFETREILALVTEQASIQFFDANNEKLVGESVPADVDSGLVNCRVLACADQRMLFSGMKDGLITLTMVQVEGELQIKIIGSFTAHKHFNSILGASCT